MYHLFAITTFLGSFLIFFSELLYAKKLLPWFGGSATVWLVALLFFTTILFFGYLYAHIISTRFQKNQYRIHVVLVSIVLVCTFLQVYFWGGLMPPHAICCATISNPSHAILIALTLTLGLHVILLASGSVLLITWYAHTSSQNQTHRDPHTLYRYSNAGSLSALALFPLLMEPMIGMILQERIWIGLYLAYLMLLFWCIRNIATTQTTATEGTLPTGTPDTPPTAWRMLAWIGYATLGTTLLLSGTHLITESITPAPFLWSLPLALYLVSYIIAFSENRIRMTAIALITLVSTFAVAFISIKPINAIFISILLVGLYLGVASTLIHATLFALRPRDAIHLSRFYLAIASGGALGTFCIAYVAPRIWNTYWEIPIVLTMVTILTYRTLAQSGTQNRHATYLPYYRWIAGLMLMWTAGIPIIEHGISANNTLARSRNFYGVSKVEQYTIGKDAYTAIVNGNIIHGVQHKGDLLELSPTTYYARGSGVEYAFLLARSHNQSLAVAAIGLGAGTVAAYCTPNDRYTFFELNPAVMTQARTYFTFLASCTHEVILGDGRLELEAQVRDHAIQYDLIILDAFTDDAIPATLLTREAFELYRKALTEHGVLAMHISNSYLDLLPVVHAGITHIGMAGLQIDGIPKTRGASASNWVIASNNASELAKISVSKEMKTVLLMETSPTHVWTDDRSSILPLITW